MPISLCSAKLAHPQDHITPIASPSSPAGVGGCGSLDTENMSLSYLRTGPNVCQSHRPCSTFLWLPSLRKNFLLPSPPFCASPRFSGASVRSWKSHHACGRIFASAKIRCTRSKHGPATFHPTLSCHLSSASVCTSTIVS